MIQGWSLEEGMSTDGQRALLGSEAPRPCRGALSRAVPFFEPWTRGNFADRTKYVFSPIDKQAFAPHSEYAASAVSSLKWIGLKALRGRENRVMREQWFMGTPVSPFFFIYHPRYHKTTTRRASYQPTCRPLYGTTESLSLRSFRSRRPRKPSAKPLLHPRRERRK